MGPLAQTHAGHQQSAASQRVYSTHDLFSCKSWRNYSWAEKADSIKQSSPQVNRLNICLHAREWHRLPGCWAQPLELPLQHL